MEKITIKNRFHLFGHHMSIPIYMKNKSGAKYYIDFNDLNYLIQFP